MKRPMAEPHIDIVIEDPRWEEAGLEPLAHQAIRAGLAHLRIPAEAFEIVVMGCDDARIAELNAEFRQKPAPTNVLSWPAQDLAPKRPGGTPAEPVKGPPDMPESLGDIAISYDTCIKEAQTQAISLADHTQHLVLHGLLHLLGYDHETDEDATLMERLEIETLASLGIKTPY